MGDSCETAAPVESKIRKCFRRMFRVISRDAFPEGSQRVSIRPIAKSLSADDLPGAAAEAACQQDLSLTVRSEPGPRRHSNRVFYVPYYIPNTAASSSENTRRQQLLPQLCGAQQDELQQRQPRKKLFSPGTMTALQQLLVAVPAETAKCGGSRLWYSSVSASDLAYQPAAIGEADSASEAAAAAAAAAPAAPAAAAVNTVSSEGCDAGYQQQTHDCAPCQSPNSHPHHQQQRSETVSAAWLRSLPDNTAAHALQKQNCPTPHQRKRCSTELNAVRWLGELPYPCSVLDDLRLEPEQSYTPSEASATDAGLNSSEQQRWGCRDHSSAVLLAVPAAASGELDSLAALPLVNPYSAKAAVAKGASSWQGWQSGHTPHVVLASADWQ